jgi:predicted RNA polymerase sigma factor
LAGDPGAARASLAAVFREEAGRLTSSLVRWLGDFALAEELVQDALLLAIEHWPTDGIPDRPGAWLLTVARRLALNRTDRDRRHAASLAELAAREPPAEADPDDRLRLLFTCCHPALASEAQVALTLRAVCGLTTGEIAAAFLSTEAAVAQRIVRARRKIVAAGIPFALPDDATLAPRLNGVLQVLYLMFNEGHLARRGGGPFRRDVAEDALWLTELCCRLLPREPEPAGLLALMKLHLARADARFSEHDRLVLLREQDRARWDRALVAEAVATLERAAALRRPGPYQVEAAIAACHAEAPSYEATDWAQIVALYDLLLHLGPSPVVRLNRAVALREVAGLEAALAEAGALGAELDGYYLYHAVMGDLLVARGRREHARAALLRALELAANPAERALLRQRLDALERG